MQSDLCVAAGGPTCCACRVTALCFVTDGQGRLCLVSASADKSLRVWHAGTGKCARTVAKRPSEISALAAGGCVAAGILRLCCPARNLSFQVSLSGVQL